MKSFIRNFLEEYKSQVIDLWISNLTITQIDDFIKSVYSILVEAKETITFENKNPILLKSYNLLSARNLSFTQINKIFSVGKITVLQLIEKENSSKFNLLEINKFLEEIFGEIYTKYSEIHQENSLKTITDERDELLKKLEISQQYLQNILHYSDSAIMVIDDNEEFIAWSKGAEKIFGYSQKDIIGKKSSFLLPEGKKFESELNKIIDEVNTKGFSQIIETERKTKNNSIIPVQLNVAKLPGDTSELHGRTVVITDVTEVRKLRQQVDQSEKLAVIGQLAAGVAHEIGNPLASISSIVQILQRKSNDQFTSDQLVNVKDNINRISKIVRELVDLSRPPSHDELITQISEVIKTAVGIVKYDKRVKKVEFKTDFDENLPMVKIVPDQLLQVFINILINSLDAIEGEGIIKVKSRHDDNSIYINILDNGAGIDDESIDKIFDPFYTTKEVGKGTGLGLSVSYGIIKKFNGDITVKSKSGEGCDFQVQIPFQDFKIKDEK